MTPTITTISSTPKSQQAPSSLWPFLGAFAKLQNVTISFITPICLHGTTQLPLDRIFMKFENFFF
jgi:hypothetical protein